MFSKSDNFLFSGVEVNVDEMIRPGIVHADGLLLFGIDGKGVNVTKLGLDSGKMVTASKYGQEAVKSDLGTLSPEEEDIGSVVRNIWGSILSTEVESDTDFFDGGAGSMDVTRMVEEVRDKLGLEVETTDVYMATVFEEFFEMLILLSRGGSSKNQLIFEGVKVEANGHKLNLPTQLFINNEFVPSSDPAKKLRILNPTDESLICETDVATGEDVDRAVEAAEAAFDEGEWSRMNARDRGKLLTRLAQLMEEHKEELATIESIDSGAVYTLALKTHVGMSIDTWRYFAGWCDKIQGKCCAYGALCVSSTVPIAHDI
jgi:formyltetrahydrofolate dehydrogenase